MAGTVSVRRLSGHASRVIREVAETGKATFVTKRGRPAAAIAPIGADGADDPSDHVLCRVLTNAPEYATSMRQADEDLVAGHTSSMAGAVADPGGCPRPSPACPSTTSFDNRSCKLQPVHR